MFNVGGPEFVVILIVALVVLGPTRLPGALRQVGKFIGEAKKLSANFQNEVNDAMADPVKKVTGIEGAELSKLPRSSRDLVGFAVPEPFAAMEKKEEPADAESPESSSTDADGSADAPTPANATADTSDLAPAKPALQHHSPEANGMATNGFNGTVANGAAANEAVANAAAANALVNDNSAANTGALNKKVEPSVIHPQDDVTSAPAPIAPSPDDDGDDVDEVPMFGDR